MRALKSKEYVRATQKSKQYQCEICSYIPEKVYSCKGPCGKTFCFQCLKCIKNNQDECPFRCSKPFQVTEGKPIQIEFNCPFNPEKCETPIVSVGDFYNHHNECKFVPSSWKEKQENYNRYRCEQGHDLFYLDQQGLKQLYGYQFYEKAINAICAQCEDKALCRSLCPKCSTKDKFVLYCTSCRKPPCTKATCLYQHNLKKMPNYGNKGLYCDFCGTASYLLGPYAYRDTNCNFDICEGCYDNLPEQHELVPFTMPKNVIQHLVEQPPQPNYHLAIAQGEQPDFQSQQDIYQQDIPDPQDYLDNEDDVDVGFGFDPLEIINMDEFQHEDQEDYFDHDFQQN